MTALTDYERHFADQHHDIVHCYLRARGLSINEYYDVVIFRYLGAVQRYLSDPELRQYPFETIAKAAMRSALGGNFKVEKRNRAFCSSDTDLVETCAGYEADEMADDGTRLIWVEVKTMLTESEKALVSRRADGWTYREIAEESGLSAGTMSRRMSKLRKRIGDQYDVDPTLAGIIG